jgi:hypothetical protein
MRKAEAALAGPNMPPLDREFRAIGKAQCATVTASRVGTHECPDAMPTGVRRGLFAIIAARDKARRSR